MPAIPYFFLLESSDPNGTTTNGAETGLAGLTSTLLAPIFNDQDFVQSVDNYEKLILSNAIKRHKTIKSVCDRLNIARSSLDMKRSKFRLDAEMANP